MAESYILKNGKVVKGTDFTGPVFFTTGHLAYFTTPDGEKYTCINLLEISKSSISYVEEKSFYEHIKNEEYGKMKLYNDWKYAEEGDIIKMKKREIDINFNYCWYNYHKNFEKSDFFTGEEINISSFEKGSGECDLNVLSEAALTYFDNNVTTPRNMPFASKIGDIAQLINNIDKYIYEAFTSPSEIDELKTKQIYIWKTIDTSLLTDSQIGDYYDEYYKDLLNYYNEAKKRLYILNNSTDIQSSVLIAMSMHPTVLVGLNVYKKIEMLKYLVNNILSAFKDKVEYEEFVVNLSLSFDETNITDVDIFLDELINKKNSISDNTQSGTPSDKDFEISKNSATLFETLYTRMSQSWDITEGSITLINYIPGFNFEPVLTRQNFADAVYRLWMNSKYNPYKDNVYNDQLLSLVGSGENTTFKYTKKPAIKYFLDMHYNIDKTAAPVIINYKSESKFGMFYQNFIFEFTGNNKVCALTNDWNIIKPTQTAPEPPVSKAWFPYGYYDIYQPVTLLDHKSDTSIPILTVDNKDASGDLENYNSIIPIFYIKHIAELNKRKNAEFLIFRAIDLISIFKLQGTLATKLTHIRQLSKFDQAIVFSNVLQLVGTDVNFILSFISNCNNSEFCKKLKTLMTWLEFSQLATDSLSLLQKKIAAKKFIQEVEDNGVPNSFDTPAGQRFISHAEDIAEGTADLAVILEKLVDDIFDLIKPNFLRRIEKSPNIFDIEFFNLNFTNDGLKSFIRECIDLDFQNSQFIEDVILMACRKSKPSTYAELLIQVNYYKKVILAKGFPSGFENLADFKLYCIKATTFLESLPFIGGKVIEYRVQGSTLFKRAEGIDPPDSTNTPFLPNNPPRDLDVQLLMSKSNAIVLVNELKQRWTRYLDTLDKKSLHYKKVSGNIKRLDKVLDNEKGGLILTDLIIDKVPLDLYDAYRNAIKVNGEDMFKVILDGDLESNIGFSIIIKNSSYDVLPVMPFKK